MEIHVVPHGPSNPGFEPSTFQSQKKKKKISRPQTTASMTSSGRITGELGYQEKATLINLLPKGISLPNDKHVEWDVRSVAFLLFALCVPFFCKNMKKREWLLSEK